MSGVSGNIALLRLPADQRPHVQLSNYFYASTLARLREDILRDRSGLVSFEVATPISALMIHVAMRRDSTYVLGYRPDRLKTWWVFQEPDRPLPAPFGQPSRSMRLTGSYTELGLGAAGAGAVDSTDPSNINDDLSNTSGAARLNMRPERLLTLLDGYDGNPDPEFCQAIVLLLFLVAEALRFDNVLRECIRYFTAIPPYACSIRPGFFASTVRNWAGSRPGHPNVLVPYLG